MGGAVICRAAFHFQPFPAMARLHIIIGYASRSNDAEPHVLHAGRDADAAIAQRQQALRPGGWCRVEHIDGARGLVKHNSDASATQPQTAAEQAAAEPVAAEPVAAEPAESETLLVDEPAPPARGKAKN